MQSRQNIAKSAFQIIAEEARRLFINKSADALRNMPAREILTSKFVEHINSYYKLVRMIIYISHIKKMKLD